MTTHLHASCIVLCQSVSRKVACSHSFHILQVHQAIEDVVQCLIAAYYVACLLGPTEAYEAQVVSLLLLLFILQCSV